MLALHKSYLWHGLGRADFGSKPSPRRRAELEKLHPAGLTDDWADKLAGKEFYSHNLKATFEHYLQVPSRRLQISIALSCAAEQAQRILHARLGNMQSACLVCILLVRTDPCVCLLRIIV